MNATFAWSAAAGAVLATAFSGVIVGVAIASTSERRRLGRPLDSARRARQYTVRLTNGETLNGVLISDGRWVVDRRIPDAMLVSAVLEDGEWTDVSQDTKP